MTLFDPTPPRRVTLEHPNGAKVVAEITDGSGPAIVWLCGYASDMQGTKIAWLSEQCSIWGWRLAKFDFRGTGASDGTFADQTLSDWLADALLVIDQLTDGPVILTGSSMGAWLALEIAQLRPERIAALALIAPAPDFTKRYWDSLSAGEQQQAESTGILPLERNNPLTFKLVQDGNRSHLVMDKSIAFDGPVEILHGQQDTIALPQLAHDVAAALTTPAVTLHLVKDADHSLSRPQDLRLLWQSLARLREILMPSEA